jgi:hypothetical protein
MKNLKVLSRAILIGAVFFSFLALASDITDKYPGNRGIILIKNQKDQDKVRQRLEEVDVAFELGDGYYDVQKTQLFRVWQGGKILGYIERIFLSYTEDPELVVALVRYNPNGVRVGEIEVVDRFPCSTEQEPLSCIPQGY